MSTSSLTRHTSAMDTAPTQAIAPRASAQVIRTPDAYRERLALWNRERYHVLSPFANFDALPDHFGIVPALVQIDPNETVGDVYRDPLFCEQDEVSIAKIGLSKIAMAGGMSITTTRTDPRTIPNLWEVQATARFIGLDGTPQVLQATEELDLRDGSDRSLKVMGKNRSQGALVAARAKGLRGCEARAINAVIRQYGIKQKYKKAELAKPFVVLRVVYMPDMTDPSIRQLVNERALGGAAMLYPGQPAAPAAAPEAIDVIGASVVDARQERPTLDATPAKTPRVVEHVEHDMEAGTFEVRLDGGEVVTTQAQEVARGLLQAKKDGVGVHVTVDAAGQITGFERASPAAPARREDGGRAAGSGVDLPPGQARITHVDKRTGEGKKGPWTLYKVTFSSGQIATTFSASVHKLIDEAVRTNAPVKYLTEAADGDYDDKITNFEVVDSRQGSLPMTEEGGKY